MANPKRKWSKARTGARRSQWKLSSLNLAECQHCHAPKLPHTVCGTCGQYRGRKVVEV